MVAPDGDGHSADADGERIPAKGTKVKRFNGDTFVEAELPQTADLGFLQRFPVDGRDARASPELERIEGDCKGLAGLCRIHLRLIINNESCWEAQTNAAGSAIGQGSG